MIQTISSPLCDPIPFNDPILKVQLSVTISKDGVQNISRYRNENGDFITVNTNPRIVFRYLSKESSWENHHQVIIVQRSMFNLKLGFKKFYRIFQREDLFKYDYNGNICELLSYKEDTVIIPLHMNQSIRLEPYVISDRNGRIYPGVLMTLNRQENRVEITIDEFETLYDIITSINLVQSGLTLLQTYIGLSKVPMETKLEEDEKKRESTKDKPTSYGSIFGNKVKNTANSSIIENKEIVSGGIIKTPTDLYDLQ